MRIDGNFQISEKDKKTIIKGLEPMVEGAAAMPAIDITVGSKKYTGSYNGALDIFTVNTVEDVKKPKAQKK